MNGSVRRSRDDCLGVLRSRLRAYVSRDHNGLEAGRIEVELRSKNERPLATVYFFRVRLGQRERDLVVKVVERQKSTASRRDDERGPADFPRLGLLADPDRRFQFERRTLTAIHSYFAELGDERFGSIRVLDSIPECLATVMEKAEGVSLRALLLRRAFKRYPSGGEELATELLNSGAWLARYHEFVKTDHARPRRTTRDDFVASIWELTAYLSRSLGMSDLFQQVARRTEEVAVDILPFQLPLGLSHGDFAPRNVIVHPSGRVTILDTQGRWRVPIYEDIACFLVGMKSIGPQVVSLGLAFSRGHLRCYEESFLRGYFGEGRVALAAVRLFEIESVLARWASAASLARRTRGLLWMRRRAERELKSYWFRRLVTDLLSQLSGMEGELP